MTKSFAFEVYLTPEEDFLFPKGRWVNAFHAWDLIAMSTKGTMRRFRIK
jgi:hypothetical protein